MSVHRWARLARWAAACATLGCATAPPVPPPAPPSPAVRAEAVAPAGEVAGLSFAVDPADAEIVIDGRALGRVAELPRGGTVPLQPGLYQVSLRRSGFATWRAEVAVRTGVQPIRVTLTRKP